MQSVEAPVSVNASVAPPDTAPRDEIADPVKLEKWGRRYPYYTRQLFDLFRAHVPEGHTILEIGSQLGDLLALLKPSQGVGIDSRLQIVEAARRRHPELTFEHADPETFDLGDRTFDFVIVSTVLGDAKDVQHVFRAIRAACRPDTRVIIAYHNALWEPLLRLATRLGMRRPVEKQNWLSIQDLRNLAFLSGLDVIRASGEVLMPLPIPILSAVLNRMLVRCWPWYHCGLVQLLIAKPVCPRVDLRSPKVSVIIPTRNERGNIEDAVRRTPKMGGGTEIVFVDGNSTDGTADEIHRVMAANPDRDIVFLPQGDGVGKGDAVRKGFAAATGDVLMILDADLTVPPEWLPRFLDALLEGRGEFINGTRLVYPMEEKAMRFLNKCGNRFFSMAFTWLLGQPIRDTLCGTKVLTKANYDTIARNRSYFGDFDPFGDFDLLLGASKANLKIVEVPVRYDARKYGTTNISRFRHGLILLKMSWFAMWRLKFR
ncbi:MAG: glycosyltransferase [Planctomycetota bacterium]|nr:glycosyltransferase [Planctomycetota bacterium]